MNARGRGLVVAAALLSLGCDSLIDVDPLNRVPAEKLDDPALAAVLVNSAIGDFECAFGNYVALVAQVSGEFSEASNLGALVPIALRRPSAMLNPSDLPGCSQVAQLPNRQLYIPLSIARYQADDVLERLSRWTDEEVPNRDSLLATAAAYAGYGYTLFGEGFCTCAFNGGPELQPKAVLAIAEQRFDSALYYAQRVNNTELLNFARIGRARVRINLAAKVENAGDVALAAQFRADAATDAKLIAQTTYVKNATFSADSPRRQNQVQVWNNGAGWVTVDTSFRDLAVAGVPDPRVPVQDAGRNASDATRLWVQMKYVSDASPIPIATWEEAQLIIAEAEGGQSAVDRINQVRAKHGLPAFASSDEATIVQQLREERRRTLFLQGHRLNDMLRFVLPFKTGTDAKGRLYGDMTCFPMPLVETCNNPNINRCS